MKIAIIDPALHGMGEGRSSARAKALYSRLTGDKIDKTLFGNDDSGTLAVVISHPSQAFEMGNDFDIIHFFDYPPAATYASFVDAVIMVSITEMPKAGEIEMLGMGGKNLHLVADGIDPVAGMKFSGLINEDPEDFSKKYMEIYSVCLDQRENHRPWGFYENLTEGREHKVKRITVFPGKRLSLQKHHKRAEHWLIVAGNGIVTIGEEKIEVLPGMAVDIPKEAIHRIENKGASPLIFVEVQMGDYFGEDDIVRLEDDFGRVKPG